MAARELHLGRHSSQPLLKRERCPGAQPHSRTNEGAIANRACPQTSDRGQVRNVADRRSRVGGAAAGHHVLIRIRRWKEGRPLADSHKAWLM